MATNGHSFLIIFLFYSFVNIALAQVSFIEREEDDTQGMTMDQIIQNAASSSYAMDYTQPDDTVLIELDMKYKKADWERIKRYRLDDRFSIEGDDPIRRRYKRKAVRMLTHRWSNNEVPYIISNIFSQSNRDSILGAFEEYHRHTCIRFRQATSRDTNKIAIQNGGGCSSFVGMVGGTQGVFLAPACRKKGVVIHELGHALGFQHEQTRPDRDQYVRILEDNIPQRYKMNFQRYGQEVVDNFGVEYDYLSVMHYGGTAFSVNGKPTIATLDVKYQNSIGQRMGLSFRDIKLANLMYSYSGQCPRKLKCPGEGFQGKNCKCWCPGDPVKPCEEENVGQPNEECKDKHQGCPYFKGQGYCTNQYAGSMEIYCRKTCGLCSGTTNQKCRLPHVENSKIQKQLDYITDVWAEFEPGVEIEVGCLPGYIRWGARYLTCREDGSWNSATPRCDPDRTNAQCSLPLIDNGKYAWVTPSDDSFDYGYNYGDDDLDQTADDVPVLIVGEMIAVECYRGYTHGGVGKITCRSDGTLSHTPKCVPENRVSCVDRNRNCGAWARYGECRRNPGYMLNYCKKSCNVCR